MQIRSFEIIVASSLAISAMTLANPVYGQSKSTEKGKATSTVNFVHSSTCARKANNYSPKGQCECAVRETNRNGNVGSYAVCNLHVKLGQGHLTLRTFQPLDQTYFRSNLGTISPSVYKHQS